MMFRARAGKTSPPNRNDPRGPRGRLKPSWSPRRKQAEKPAEGAHRRDGDHRRQPGQSGKSPTCAGLANMELPERCKSTALRNSPDSAVFTIRGLWAVNDADPYVGYHRPQVVVDRQYRSASNTSALLSLIRYRSPSKCCADHRAPFSERIPRAVSVNVLTKQPTGQYGGQGSGGRPAIWTGSLVPIKRRLLNFPISDSLAG